MKQIEVKDLVFSYDGEEDVVSNVSFSVEKGSYTTIIGQNGSGKSTIAKLLVGLLDSSSGEVIIDGLVLNLENIEEIRRKIGIVFQNPDNQFIGATVRDDIAFGLENQLVEPEKMDDIINHFAKEVNMTDFLEHEPVKLSGGQKQRVAIAGVLAMTPDIIIFDEATSMLDPLGKKEINDLIMKIHEEKKLTIISITHDIEEVTRSDKVLVIDRGKIVLAGPPQEILVKEKDLLSINLDIPFATKLVNSLEKQGLSLSKHITIEGLVNELCQLSLKE